MRQKTRGYRPVSHAATCPFCGSRVVLGPMVYLVSNETGLWHPADGVRAAELREAHPGFETHRLERKPCGKCGWLLSVDWRNVDAIGPCARQ